METAVHAFGAPRLIDHHTTAGLIEQCWAGELVTVSVVRYVDAVSVSPRATTAASFTLVLRGRFADVFEARRFDYRPLSVVFHPDGLTYGRQVGRGGADVVTIELSPRMVRGLSRSRTGVGAVRDLSGSPHVWALLSVYADLASAGRHPLLIEEPVAEVLHTLAASRQRGPLQEPPWMSRVTRLIATRFREPLSLARCASVAGVQPVYLTRVYRRVFGQSIRESVHRLRTVAACRLVQSGRLSLAEVASQIGFDDESQVAAACHGLLPRAGAGRRALGDSLGDR